MASLKISATLLKDLESKRIALDLNKLSKATPPPKLPIKEIERNQSFNSSDSLEKTTTTINFKIRPCTPNPEAILERKNETSQLNIRSAKTTLTTFPSYKKDAIVTEKEDIIPEAEESLFLKEFTEETLSTLTGTDPQDFPTLHKLTLKVDLSLNSLQNLGFLLPNLRELKINSSKLSSLRDIGTSLVHLEVLWASRCGLQDLAGILMFQSLSELYVSFNSIRDLTDIGFLNSLQVLDLEGNEVDLANLEHLQPLKELYSLNLAQNPIAGSKEYPKCVYETVRSLEVLDEQQIGSPIKVKEKKGVDGGKEEAALEELIRKFGKYREDIDISGIREKAEKIFDEETSQELREEELLLQSIKRTLGKGEKKNGDRPKTASIFRSENNGVSELVSSNDVAFFGNPLKIFKHKRGNNIPEIEEECVPQKLISLINEFKVEKESDDNQEIDSSSESEEISNIDENDELSFSDKNSLNETNATSKIQENPSFLESKINSTMKQNLPKEEHKIPEMLKRVNS